LLLGVDDGGGVSINDTLLHIAQEGLPFGGVGPSGQHHGRLQVDGALRYPNL
jgi:coniferyl-aldehyde dehydrogenase